MVQLKSRGVVVFVQSRQKITNYSLTPGLPTNRIGVPAWHVALAPVDRWIWNLDMMIRLIRLIQSWNRMNHRINHRGSALTIPSTRSTLPTVVSDSLDLKLTQLKLVELVDGIVFFARKRTSVSHFDFVVWRVYF